MPTTENAHLLAAKMLAAFSTEHLGAMREARRLMVELGRRMDAYEAAPEDEVAVCRRALADTRDQLRDAMARVRSLRAEQEIAIDDVDHALGLRTMIDSPSFGADRRRAVVAAAWDSIAAEQGQHDRVVAHERGRRGGDA